MKVRLTPKTRRAQQKLSVYGSIGEVICESSTVEFSAMAGPWLLVKAADPESRWVHKTQDPHFHVQHLH